jgi:hypothetical protein
MTVSLAAPIDPAGLQDRADAGREEPDDQDDADHDAEKELSHGSQVLMRIRVCSLRKQS